MVLPRLPARSEVRPSARKGAGTVATRIIARFDMVYCAMYAAADTWGNRNCFWSFPSLSRRSIVKAYGGVVGACAGRKFTMGRSQPSLELWIGPLTPISLPPCSALFRAVVGARSAESRKSPRRSRRRFIPHDPILILMRRSHARSAQSKQRGQRGQPTADANGPCDRAVWPAPLRECHLR